MIELIYNEEEKYMTGEGKLTEPKNVKQIGEPKEYKKIFLEDYVHTFLVQYSGEKEGQVQLAVLLGNGERSGGKRHLYIKSALPVEHIAEKHGKYVFSEKLWGDIYQQCEKYFPDQEIMGWFFSKSGFSVEKTNVIEETQRTYFSGADKVLFMVEPIEGESGFFAFDGNRFAKQPGYYIYYEKNEPMHEFLLEKNSIKKDSAAKEKTDVAVANFRKILKEKQVQTARKRKAAISYMWKFSVALALLLSVVIVRSQTEELQRMEEQIHVLTEDVVETGVYDEVVVEELPGDVYEKTEEQPEELPVTEAEAVVSQPIEEPVLEEVQPTKTPVLEEPQPTETPAAEETALKTYVVQTGDTLAKISRDQYGNDDMIEEICSLNQIPNGDYIQVGETILLP